MRSCRLDGRVDGAPPERANLVPLAAAGEPWATTPAARLLSLTRLSKMPPAMAIWPATEAVQWQAGDHVGGKRVPSREAPRRGLVKRTNPRVADEDMGAAAAQLLKADVATPRPIFERRRGASVVPLYRLSLFR